MPTYEYRCRSCGEHLEIVQSFKDDPLTECPKCGGQLRKVFGNIGIAFKGSGFYKTDSRPAAKADKDSGGSSTGAAASSASPATSDSTSTASKTSSSDSGKSSSGSGSGTGKAAAAS